MPADARDATDRYRRSSAAALRTLARSGEPSGASELLAILPAVPDPGERAYWRGRLDALAMRVRYSSPDLHAELAPTDGSRRAFFDLLEQSRVDALVPHEWPGVRQNLAALNAVVLSGAGASARTLIVAARRRFGVPVSKELHQHASTVPSEVLERMAAVLHDQRAFGLEALRLIDSIMIDSTPTPAEASHDRAADEPAPEPNAHAAETNAPQAAGPTDSGHVSALHRARDEPRGRVVPRETAAGPAAGAYHAYTTRFDCVLDAKDLCVPERLAALEQELNVYRRDAARHVKRWAHRLQRRLMSRQLRSWRFDLEEGVLDCSRLTRLATDPVQPLSFKQEAAADFPDTSVAVLVDNSGSMRGAAIATAAMCSEILGRVLERCGVRSEILGYTTRRWRGGRTREQWVRDGCPADPGRLTDLLHIVYKDAATPWRRAHRRIASMLDEDLLKENVDGEALLWAHDRLMRRPGRRRILIVVCDGAPLDDATLAANDSGYLDRGLRSVIRRIERSSPVELIAIGVGHDVGDYYSNAFTVNGLEALGEAMAAGLIALLGKNPQGENP